MHIASSSFFKYIVACAFGVPADSVLLAGQPRCDVLRFADEVETPGSTVRKILSISEHNKFIVWMPTFRAETANLPADGRIRSFVDDTPEALLAALDSACKANACTVLIKLHPWELMKAEDSRISKYSSFRLLTAKEWGKYGMHLYDLLAASDALMSDVSSVVIDYLATQRPIGILGYDKQTYARGLSFPLEWIQASSRVHGLTDAASVDEFLSQIVDPQPKTQPSIESSFMFVEERNEKGSELIAKALSL